MSIGTSAEEIEALLERVRRAGADVFVPYFAGADQIALLTRFTELGLKKRMAVVMGHYDEVMVSRLPPRVREGFYSSNTYFMSVDTPESRCYLERLARQPGVSGIWPIVERFGCIPPEIPARYRHTSDAAAADASPPPRTTEAAVASEAEAAVQALGPAQDILTAADVGVVATDSRGVIIEANPQLCALFGYSRAELIGMSVHLLLPPHFRAAHAKQIAAFLTSEVQSRQKGRRGEKLSPPKPPAGSGPKPQ